MERTVEGREEEGGGGGGKGEGGWLVRWKGREGGEEGRRRGGREGWRNGGGGGGGKEGSRRGEGGREGGVHVYLGVIVKLLNGNFFALPGSLVHHGKLPVSNDPKKLNGVR